MDAITQPIVLPDSAPEPHRRSDPGLTQPAPVPSRGRSAAAALRRAARQRRRFERTEVRRFTRRSRRRRTAWLSSLVALATVLVLVVAVALSPLMALRTIRVEGTNRLDAKAVTASLDGQLGRPLPLIDFGAVRHQLAGFPLIRSYTVESHPPGTMIVRIRERQPIGFVERGAGFALLDPAGVTVAVSSEPPVGYPKIHAAGATAAPSSASFAAAAAVLAALPADFLGQVAEATASTKDDVSLVLTGGQDVIWGGPGQAQLKATVLSKLIAATQGQGVTRYDVSSPTSAVVY
ncbi:MAG: FtsQ-type POTRA domain-containing protein [Microbacteriaceae bacterium]